MATPTTIGEYDGQVVKQIVRSGRASSKAVHYMWDDEKGVWVEPKTSWHAAKSGEYQREFGKIYDEQQAAIKAGEDPSKGKKTVDPNKKLTIGPLEGATPDGGTQRWPNDQIQEETDYVFFQFGKYIPPFSQDAMNKSWKDKRGGYDQSISRMKVDDELPSIMLPIPQDLSNAIAAGWQGKAFTGLGRAAISAMAGGSMDALTQKMGDFTGNMRAIQDSLTTSVLNLVPGVGGNLDANDISGATRGVVLNPNAELLYDSPELREIGMSFKMVPKNQEEAQIIRTICQAFRKAALPSWGAKDVPALNQIKNVGDKGNFKVETREKTFSGENFIRVPRLCKFTFMKGNKPHEYLTQFKPCAMSAVTVKFTPDNTYATYNDGSPVATELRISFQETKLIFAGEVNMKSGGSF